MQARLPLAALLVAQRLQHGALAGLLGVVGGALGLPGDPLGFGGGALGGDRLPALGGDGLERGEAST